MAGEESEWPPGTFETTCLNLVRQDLNSLFGAEIIYFNRPVDLKYVPDYYKVGTGPSITLGTAAAAAAATAL